MANVALAVAKKAKQDEFDTQWVGIARDLFDDRTKRAACKLQTGEAEVECKSNWLMCALGHKSKFAHIYQLTEMEADHVSAWSKSGFSDLANCQPPCEPHIAVSGIR